MLSKIRRFILQHIVPEFVWPNEIDLEGIPFKVRGTPYSFGIKYLLSRNAISYEQPERLFLKYLNQGDHVLELGSSIGIISRLILNKVGPEGKLLAVEASEKLTRFSSKWLEKLPNAKIINSCAFPVHHSLPINFHFDDTRGSLGGTVAFIESEATESKMDAFFIETAELKYNFYANVLVCDIEGSEIILLQKNALLPTYIKTIIIELHPGIYNSEIALQLIDRIKSFGYILQASLHSVYVFQQQDLNNV